MVVVVAAIVVIVVPGILVNVETGPVTPGTFNEVFDTLLAAWFVVNHKEPTTISIRITDTEAETATSRGPASHRPNLFLC